MSIGSPSNITQAGTRDVPGPLLELTDVKTLIGLQWLQKWRAGAWTLDWRPAP